jgi:hypothetical protein
MGQGDYQELRDLSIAQDLIGQLLRSLCSLVATESPNPQPKFCTARRGSQGRVINSLPLSRA